MANPQLENGYVKIANDIFDALSRIRISGEARQVLDVIIRKTYGYNKKEDAISLSQFCLATGMRRGDVIRGSKKLMEMNIISKKANDIANVYRINKDFDTWKPLAKKQRGVAKKQISVSKIANNDKQKSNIQKTVSKDNTTKDIYTSANADSFNQFWGAYPKKELKKKSKELWDSKKLDSQIVVILNFITLAQNTDRWKKGYIKAPPVFLRGECWNDDLSSYNDKSFSTKKIDNVWNSKNNQQMSEFIKNKTQKNEIQ